MRVEGKREEKPERERQTDRQTAGHTERWRVKARE